LVLLSSTYLLSRLAFLSLLALPSHFDGPMVIRNPGNFGPWNPESTALEFGIRNPTISKSGIQPLMESGIHRHGIRNPQYSKGDRENNIITH